jgi:hypothetical protein
MGDSSPIFLVLRFSIFPQAILAAVAAGSPSLFLEKNFKMSCHFHQIFIEVTYNKFTNQQ